MMKKEHKIAAFWALSLMIVLAAATRFLMIPNFTAVGAMGLLGAAHFRHKAWAFALPFAALFLSDLVLNNVFYAQYHEGFVWFHEGAYWTYLGFAGIVLLGILGLRSVSPSRLLGVSVSASLLFFLISNFGVWVSSAMYSKDAAGLALCYTAGLPFLAPSMLGDLLYAALLFGLYEWAVKPLHTLRPLDA